MNKLCLDDLSVDSFVTDESSITSGGTVNGQELSVDELCIDTQQDTCEPCGGGSGGCGTDFTNCGCDYTEDFNQCNTINGYFGCTGNFPCIA